MAWNWLSDRTPGYLEIAKRLKMSFQELDEQKRILAGHKNFILFKTGSSKKIKNILIGITPLQESLNVFEYFYTVSTGKSAHTYIQHVYSVGLVQPIVPFRLRPQHFFHAIGKWFGMQDIDFSAYPEFNKNYILQSDQEAETRALFTDTVLGFLNYEQDWSIECDGHQIIYYKFEKRMNEEMVEPFIQAAGAIHALAVGKKAIEDLSIIKR